MSVLRSSAVPVGLVLLLAVVAACGAASPTGSASIGAGTTPAPASQPVQPSSDAGTGTVNNPPIVDGGWTSGNLHIEVSGDVTATLDYPLQGGMSMTTAGATLLSFADAANSEGGGIVVASTGNAITLSSSRVSTAGGDTGDANQCTIAVTQSDASKLAGTFDCKRLVGVVASESRNVTVDMRGTFEATR
jgi:hypothetical protein